MLCHLSGGLKTVVSVICVCEHYFMSRYLLGETAAIFISYKDPNRLEYDKIIDSVKSNPISCLFYWSTGIPELVTNCVRFSPNRTNV